MNLCSTCKFDEYSALLLSSSLLILDLVSSQPAHRVVVVVADQGGGVEALVGVGDSGDLSEMKRFLKEILTLYGVSYIS